MAASFYPLWFFTQQVAGDRAAVFNVTPPGIEPHDYEPTAQDLTRIEAASLVILNGAGFEPWGDKVTANVDTHRTLVVAVADDLTSLQIIQDGRTAVDPHVWLAPLIARRMVDRIAQSLEHADPAEAAEYASNASRLDSRLADLDAAYRQGLAHCATRSITTSHAAFGYLAAAYGLEQNPIAGLSPDAEPSPRQLAGVVRLAQARGVTTIFFERLVSPKLAETVAHEIGARTLVLDPLEQLTKGDLLAGRDYFSIMMQNLANLEAGLQCRS